MSSRNVVQGFLARLFKSSRGNALGNTNHRLLAMESQLEFITEIVMSLSPEVLALVEEVAASKAVAHGAAIRLGDLREEVAGLSAKIAAIVPSDPIDAEDLAAIKAATASLGESVAEVAAALAPAPASAPTEDVPIVALQTDGTPS